MRETMGKGVRDALLAAVLFGLSAPVAKSLVGDLPPQLVAVFFTSVLESA
jgi:hypothetical protein